MTDRRIGLLVCDHVAAEFREIAGDYPDMFADLMGGVELVRYDVAAGEVPSDPTVCDGWLATGSRLSVYDDEQWISELVEFVRRVDAARVPFVGVCFGHQLIAEALGGRVAKAPGGWGVGARVARVVVGEPWMQPSASEFRVLYSHQDQVTALPPGGRVLAVAEHAPVAMLAVGDHLLGIQGHPEFAPAYARALLESRRGRRIPVDVADAALASLDASLDRGLVAAWMLAFLT